MAYLGWVWFAATILPWCLWIGSVLWSRRRTTRLILFHLPYGCNAAQVVETVTNAVSAAPVEGIAGEPKLSCVIVEFAPAQVTFGIPAVVKDRSLEHGAVSEILLRVDQALKRMGAPLQTVTQTIRIPSIAPVPSIAVVPSIAAVHAAPAAAPVPVPAPMAMPAPLAAEGEPGAKVAGILRSILIFRGLPEEAVRRLAPSLTDEEFAPGDMIVRQGDESGSMYIVIRGSVDVHVDGEGGISVFVATLEAGQFFGELSVFTGERRTANVVATTQVECLVVDKHSLMSLFDWRPELAEDIADVITRRQAGLAASKVKLDSEQKRLLETQHHGAILERIQNYFNLGTGSKQRKAV